MCGICGKLNFDPERAVTPGLLKNMASAIAHRGPDDEGYYFSKNVGLGFRRLSIIDLNTGHQPISNEDGTVWIIFNGEIYNYRELRKSLLEKGHVFKTQTDTEVIVHLYEELGVGCVERLRGMFALAVWDEGNKSLFIARDRVGIKPLYYWSSQDSIVFGSEMKSILADPEVEPQVLPEMVDRFMRFYYLPGDETLFSNIRKLAPGHYLHIRNRQVQVKRYWDLHFSTGKLGLQDAEQQLSNLLEESVGLHMISDVPIGFLLSGGVDSTAMLGLAAGKTEQPVSSFTLGFSENGLVDERPYARLAAQKYGVDHHEMTIDSQQFADFLPKFAWHMEEPVCEPQAVALYYVSRLAKSFVKVLISGEGGDEAFTGYQAHRGVYWVERIKQLLGPARGLLAPGLSAADSLVNSSRLAKYAAYSSAKFEEYYYSRISNPFTFYGLNLRQFCTKEFQSVIRKEASLEPLARVMREAPEGGIVNRMLYVDTKMSLPDDLLLKADKMTMANSIELRVPFLDHELLEFAASLPENYKMHGLTTKYLARRVLKKRVPRETLERKKAGFPVPYDRWLRTELRDWSYDVLLDARAISRGYFNRAAVEQLLRENIESGNHPKEILSLLALELWHRIFVDHDRSAVESFSPGASLSV